MKKEFSCEDCMVLHSPENCKIKEFNKGAELDKQIYKEGEPTWGCKWGVLDVDDVKEFIKVIKKELCLNYDEVDKIDKRAGDKLI